MKALRAMFGVAVVIFVFYAIYLVVPPYFHNYELQDAVTDEARVNSYTAKSEDEMRETVLRKAKDLEIALTREQINVQRQGQAVAISIDYTVHVDIPFYPLDLQFHSSSKSTRSF